VTGELREWTVEVETRIVLRVDVHAVDEDEAIEVAAEQAAEVLVDVDQLLGTLEGTATVGVVDDVPDIGLVARGSRVGWDNDL
jgi:hypothetical protein